MVFSGPEAPNEPEAVAVMLLMGIENQFWVQTDY